MTTILAPTSDYPDAPRVPCPVCRGTGLPSKLARGYRAAACIRCHGVGCLAKVTVKPRGNR